METFEKDQPLSEFELKRYGFTEQPLVSNGRIRRESALYVARYDDSVKPLNRQSFEAGYWEGRAIYECELTRLRRDLDEARKALKGIVEMANNYAVMGTRSPHDVNPSDAAKIDKAREVLSKLSVK